MSYSQLRKQTHAAAQPVDSSPTGGCYASNCPCRGTISLGGHFLCGAHAFADALQWPRITESLRTHDWLIGLHDDLQKMDRQHQDWRGYAVQFWANQDDGEVLQPHPKEGVVPYLNRMRGELLHRCGLSTRPALRLPAEAPKGRRGMFVNGEAMRASA